MTEEKLLSKIDEWKSGWKIYTTTGIGYMVISLLLMNGYDVASYADALFLLLEDAVFYAVSVKAAAIAFWRSIQKGAAFNKT